MSTIFHRLFGKKNTKPLPQPAGEISGQEQTVPKPLPNQPAWILDPPQFLYGCAQSVGKLRSHNEDAVLSFSSSTNSDTNNMPFGLFVVADGMGGHQNGEMASSLAVRAVGSYTLGKLCDPIFSPVPTAPAESIQEIISAGVLEAHHMIVKEVQGGGTTLTAALIRGDQLTIAHVGDSRAYTVTADGVMQLLTRDHSLVKRLVELGQITEQEASYHPQRNVLYRALGQGETLEPDISTLLAPKGGYLMICSDGLWGVVPEEVISYTIMNAPHPQIACNQMVDAANQAGGPDNISVILVRVPDG